MTYRACTAMLRMAGFLAADALYCIVLPFARPIVCPSVCPWQAGALRKTVRDRRMVTMGSL